MLTFPIVKTRADSKPIYAIAGPTCSGKTALSVRLAKHAGGEIVNFDSVQLYRGINIATAKPSEEEKQGISHLLQGHQWRGISEGTAIFAVGA